MTVTKVMFNLGLDGVYVLCLKDSPVPSNYKSLSLASSYSVKCLMGKIHVELENPFVVSQCIKLLSEGASVYKLNKNSNSDDVITALEKALFHNELDIFIQIKLTQTINDNEAVSPRLEKKLSLENKIEQRISPSIYKQPDLHRCISLISGEGVLPFTDFKLPGLSKLVWRRLYRTSKSDINLGLGFGWRHSFHLELFERVEKAVIHDVKGIDKHWLELIDEEGTSHHFPVITQGTRSRQTNSDLVLYHDNDGMLVFIRSDKSHWAFKKMQWGWRLNTVTDDQSHQLHFHYSSAGRLVLIACSHSRGVEIHYNNLGQLICVKPYYKEEDQRKTIEQPLVSYVYDKFDRLITAVDALGRTERYDYFDNDTIGSVYAGNSKDVYLLKTQTLSSGLKYSYDWDCLSVNARCIRFRAEKQRFDYNFEYQHDQNLLIVTDVFGIRRHYSHNQYGLLTNIINGLGEATIYQYGHQNVDLNTSIQTADGCLTKYKYNKESKLEAVILADGSATVFAYNALGHTVKIMDPLGRCFTYRRDSNGNVLHAIAPDESNTSFSYYPDGQLNTFTAANGLLTQKYWSENAELLACKQGERLTRYSYDSLGRLNGCLNAEGLLTEYLRDPHGLVFSIRQHKAQPTESEQATPKLVMNFRYDKCAKLIAIIEPTIDGISRQNEFEYNGFGLLSRYIAADASSVSFAYDQSQSLIQIARSDGLEYLIENNENGLPAKLCDFDGRELHINYDLLGRINQITDAGTRLIHFQRDPLGRITEKSGRFKNEVQSNRFHYDKLGRVSWASNDVRKLGFKYHLNGHITENRQDTWFIHYDYNKAGQKTTMTLADGAVFKYSYDEYGNVVQLHFNDQLLITSSFDIADRLLNCHLLNDIKLIQKYDVFGRLTNQLWQRAESDLFSYQYQYNQAQQLQHIKLEEFYSERSQMELQFSYDCLDQIKTSSYTITTSDQVINAENIVFIPNAFGQIKHSDIEYQGDRIFKFQHVNFEYDDAGNQCRKFDNEHEQLREFDALNQLQRLTDHNTLTQYEYDPLGRRSAKRTETGRVDYFWQDDLLVGELSQGRFTWYIYHSDNITPMVMLKSNTNNAYDLYFYHVDHDGSIIKMTDNQGDIVWSATYCLMGKAELGCNIIENNLGFQGHYMDGESGLHYYKQRYYDPDIGVYIHQIKVGMTQDLNPYRYIPPFKFGKRCVENRLAGQACFLNADWAGIQDLFIDLPHCSSLMVKLNT